MPSVPARRLVLALFVQLAAAVPAGSARAAEWVPLGSPSGTVPVRCSTATAQRSWRAASSAAIASSRACAISAYAS